MIVVVNLDDIRCPASSPYKCDVCGGQLYFRDDKHTLRDCMGEFKNRLDNIDKAIEKSE